MPMLAALNASTSLYCATCDCHGRAMASTQPATQLLCSPGMALAVFCLVGFSRVHQRLPAGGGEPGLGGGGAPMRRCRTRRPSHHSCRVAPPLSQALMSTCPCWRSAASRVPCEHAIAWEIRNGVCGWGKWVHGRGAPSQAHWTFSLKRKVHGPLRPWSWAWVHEWSAGCWVRGACT